MFGAENFFAPEPAPKKRRSALEDFMASYQTPETPERDAYSDLIRQAPQREDYQPGTGGKIANALLAGAAGLTARSGAEAAGFGLSLRDRKFNEVSKDYGEQVKRQGSLAELEEDENNQYDKVFKQMMEMQDKKEDNDRQDTQAATQYFRAKTWEKYLESKTKRDQAKAERDAAEGPQKIENDRKRAEAAMISAQARKARVGQQGVPKPPKSPTESSRVSAEKKAMDYLGSTNPAYEKMIRRDSNGYIVGFRPESVQENMPGFLQFQQEIEGFVEQRLQQDDDDIVFGIDEDEDM